MASYHEFNASFGSYTNPYYRPSFGSRLAGGLVKLILLVGVPAGALLALYRNDVLFDGAKQLGRESDFLKLERTWLGGPPSGTPRSLQPLLEPQSAGAVEASASASSDRSSGTLTALPAAAAIARPATFASKESSAAPANTPAPARTRKPSSPSPCFARCRPTWSNGPCLERTVTCC